MWKVLILLAASLGVESYAAHYYDERLAHGLQLKIYLPSDAEKLEFIPADNPNSTSVIWQKFNNRPIRGSVLGTGSDRHFYIDQVTYEDEGSYIQTDLWNEEISFVKVAVTSKQNYVKCYIGESLYISLEGIDPADAQLSFSGPAGNATLVRNGTLVSQDLPDYWDRVQIHFITIEIRHMNYSDEGQYTLRDRKDRVVSVTRMNLTDHSEFKSSYLLMALFVLLGIPIWFFAFSLKMILRQRAATLAARWACAELILGPTGRPTGDPTGPCPPNSTPGQQGLGPGVHPQPPIAAPVPGAGLPPPPGFNQTYPLHSPSYPPPGPAMAFPAQPQQWGYQPQNQYPPSPVAPVCYPVMSSRPLPTAATESREIMMKKEEKASSPADPLLTAAPQGGAALHPGPPPSNVALISSDGGYQFQIDNNSTSFL